MKVLVTGATGFIGSYLTEELVNKGYEVRCLVRTQSDLRWIADLDVECVYGDLFNIQSLKRAAKGMDYVYHLAGVVDSTSKANFINVNYQGTKNLIEVVKKENLKRFVYLSSQSASGPSDSLRPLTEMDKAKPVSVYGRSKLAAESVINRYADMVPITILRASSVYGPRDRGLLTVFKMVKRGIVPLLSYSDKYINVIHVRDLVNGIINAGESDKTVGQLYFISENRPYSWAEISNIALRNFGKKGIRVPISFGLLNRGVKILEFSSKVFQHSIRLTTDRMREIEEDFWICSSKKIAKDIGFKTSVKIEDGINETLSWYRENSWL
jgi:nucleoside-diphosphate-sugar epimerase